MTDKIKIGISTCPNDTFAFHAILNERIDLHGLDFDFQLLDIAQLNECLIQQNFDVVKASYAAAIHHPEHYVALTSGSALGFGNGPLLLASQPNSVPNSTEQLTLCPGANTTATLLFKIFHGNTRVEHFVFSEIMPALTKQSADFGVCIHEGRFTYEQTNLYLVEDLGARWESETESPLPLGGIFAKETLGDETKKRIQSVIRDSVEYAFANRTETLESMRRYAQEFDDDVLFQHVDLYVNNWTKDLGSEGTKAIEKMTELAEHNLNLQTDSSLHIFTG